ncbi:MAG: sigma-70 family RNA polymerase sigma factor [Planctomycetes bacterium]|nr:sigma-70 family RNA polymerase sigma factor [Planctomycetota bacterium]
MTNKRFTCTNCPLRPCCQQPCRTVAAMLPGENKGRVEGLARRDALLHARRLQDRRAWVRHLLDGRHRLKGRMRQVFDLHYNDGLTTSEIAARLKLGAGTVSSHLRRARQRILRHRSDHRS